MFSPVSSKSPRILESEFDQIVFVLLYLVYGLKEFLISPSPYLRKIFAELLSYVPFAKVELAARASW